MAGQFVGMEVDRPQFATGEPFSLVGEVRRAGVSAGAAGADREGSHPGPELNDRDEAVAARSVGLLRPGLARGGVGRQRAPLRRGEWNWPARRRVVESRRGAASIRWKR